MKAPSVVLSSWTTRLLALVVVAAAAAPADAAGRRARLSADLQAELARGNGRTVRVIVSGTPDLEAEWLPLVPRCHYLWAKHDWDPKALAAALGTGVDRGKVLDDVDRALREDDAARTLQEAARDQMRAVTDWLGQIVDAELQKVAAK